MRKSARNVNRKVYTEPNEDNETSEEEEDSQHKEHDEKVIPFDWRVTWFNLRSSSHYRVKQRISSHENINRPRVEHVLTLNQP